MSWPRDALAVSVPAVLSALVGLGARWPLGLELLGLVSLGALALLAALRLGQAPCPTRSETLLSLWVGQALLAIVIGARWCSHPGLEPIGRVLTPLAALGAGLALIALVALARRPAPADPALPSLLETALGLVAAQALGLALLCALAALLRPGFAPLGWRVALVAGLTGGLTLLTCLALPRLRSWWGEGVTGGEPPATTPAGAGRTAVAAAWLIAHLPVVLALPPLLQIDSWTNVWEPDLFVPLDGAFHHPPLYSELVKAACAGLSLRAGLSGLVVLQHLLVLGLALVVEGLVRRAGGSAWVAALTGCAVAVDGSLVIYAQLIMSEMLATGFLVLAALWLVRAEETGPAGRWLALAGLAAGLATLTREVAQAWSLVALAWLAAVSPLRPRTRASLAFISTALLLPLGLVAHNYALQGRAVFTMASGRSLTSRLTTGMPSLTDPQAPPGDELERARQLIWRERDRPGGWVTVYTPLRLELGWDDDRISAAVRRLYVEQATRHPLAFLRVTLEGGWGIVRGTDTFGEILAFHDQVLAQAPRGWEALPRVGTGPSWLVVLDRLALTHRWPVLLLVSLAPLVTRGHARRLAVLALASVGCLIAVPALVEFPLPRYRLPAVPFLALGAGLGLAAIEERLHQAQRGREPAGLAA